MEEGAESKLSCGRTCQRSVPPLFIDGTYGTMTTWGNLHQGWSFPDHDQLCWIYSVVIKEGDGEHAQTQHRGIIWVLKEILRLQPAMIQSISVNGINTRYLIQLLFVQFKSRFIQFIYSSSSAFNSKAWDYSILYYRIGIIPSNTIVILRDSLAGGNNPTKAIPEEVIHNVVSLFFPPN